MGLRIQNNIAAMTAHRNLMTSNAGLNKSLERLSSGFRINRAGDDAAGLAISQMFRAEIASYKVASRNASEANSLLQVAEGAMDQMGNILTRLKELATQAASDNAGLNRDKIDAEAQALLVEYERIATSTEYAGTQLLTGALGGGGVSDLRATVAASIIDPTGNNEIVVNDTALRGTYTFSYAADANARGAQVTFGGDIASVASVADDTMVADGWAITSDTVNSTTTFTATSGSTTMAVAVNNADIGNAGELEFTGAGGTVFLNMAEGWTEAQLNNVTFDTYALTTVTATNAGQIESTNIGGLAFELDSGAETTARGIYELTAQQGLQTTTFTLTNTLTGDSQDITVGNGAIATTTNLDFDNADIAMKLTFTAGELSADSTATIVYGGSDSTMAFDTRAAGTGQIMAFEHFELPLKEGWTWQQIDSLVLNITGGIAGDEGEGMIFQIGAQDRTDHQLVVTLGDARQEAVGLTGLTLLTREGAQEALGTVDYAVQNLADVRGDIGAYMNTLQYAMADIATTIENVQAAESVIRDADMAAEMTEFVKNQILVQAGTAMLAQANMAPQSVLALLG